MSTETALVLRMCRADMTSHNGFAWPRKGAVEAPDWRPTAECGHGLHGWLWGEGDASCWEWRDGDVAIVVEIDAASAVDLSGKIKYPSGRVVLVGDLPTCAAYVRDRSPRKAPMVIGYQATAGDDGTATAGYAGTATAGDDGTATAGVRGRATAGDAGTATAGDDGTATAGDAGTATAGDDGTATAGVRGEIRVRWYCSQTDRYRTAIGYVGEGGILPGVAYVARDGKLVRKDGGS